MLTKHFENILEHTKEFERYSLIKSHLEYRKKYYTMKECRDIINQYIKENGLELDNKRGFVRFDPLLALISNKQ